MFRFFTSTNYKPGVFLAVEKEIIRSVDRGAGFWTEEKFFLLDSEKEDTEFSEVKDPQILDELQNTIAGMDIERLRFPVMKFRIDELSPQKSALDIERVYNEIIARGIGP